MCVWLGGRDWGMAVADTGADQGCGRERVCACEGRCGREEDGVYFARGFGV